MTLSGLALQHHITAERPAPGCRSRGGAPRRARPVRPKAERAVKELLLVDGLEHNRDGPLQDFVLEARDADGAGLRPSPFGMCTRFTGGARHLPDSWRTPIALVPRSLTTVRPRRLRLLLGASVLPSAHITASALTTAGFAWRTMRRIMRALAGGEGGSYEPRLPGGFSTACASADSRRRPAARAARQAVRSAPRRSARAPRSAAARSRPPARPRWRRRRGRRRRRAAGSPRRARAAPSPWLRSRARSRGRAGTAPPRAGPATRRSRRSPPPRRSSRSPRGAPPRAGRRRGSTRRRR